MQAWKLEAAKARFSEVVRQSCTNGPQTITVRGREMAVLISVEEYRRLKGDEQGSWVDRLREAALPFEFDFERDPDTGRDFEF